MSIAIFHEHDEWNAPLFAELGRRGLDYVAVDGSSPDFEPTAIGDWDILVNRMSPSAWTRGHMKAMLQTPEFLHNVELAGIPVINGSQAYDYELSKRRQLDLLRRERVRHPEGRPVLNASEIVGAAIDLEFPVLVKPNIGGSGAGIVAFDTPGELEAAVAAGMLDDLGPDGTGLVQEMLPARDNSIVRVEILGGKFLYAIKLKLQPGSFNLCPADYCDPAQGIENASDLVKGYVPRTELIDEARRIIKASGADLGGVEYLVNDRDGEAYFYDINALSNFVANAPEVVGFDPFIHLADFIEDRAKLKALA